VAVVFYEVDVVKLLNMGWPPALVEFPIELLRALSRLLVTHFVIFFFLLPFVGADSRVEAFLVDAEDLGHVLVLFCQLRLAPDVLRQLIGRRAEIWILLRVARLILHHS